MKTLTTPNEVARITSALDSELSPALLDAVIPVYEEKIFNIALGFDWYESLLDDLTDVSSAAKWAAGTYQSGDIVEYYGNYFSANTDTSTVPGGAAWDQLPKFQTEANQLVYDRYLLRLVSFYAAAPVAALAALKVAGTGTSRSEGETFRPAGFKEISSYQDHVARMVRDILFNLHLYLTRNSDNFALYVGNSSGADLPALLEQNFGFTNLE